MLKYISLNHNQITVVEDGAFENNKDLVSLDVSYNNLTSIYNITVGSEINLNYNLLQKLNVSSTFTNLQFIGNMVSSLSCAGSLSMKVLDGSNNYLSNMNCIKKMENLTSLSLSNNKFTQLTKAAFTKLINLEYLEIYNNLIKKLTPSVFKSLIALKQLYVDKLTVYRNLRSVLPKIEKLGVTSKTWNCTQTQSVADLVNVVNIILSFNEPDQTGFECQMKMDDINKLPIA